MAVGTNIGNVYKSSEGFGKAAILPSQGDTYKQASKVAKSVSPEKEKPKLDKTQLLKEIRAGKPEWWISHNQELDGEFNELLDYAADLMELNVDPTKSTDKASADWQARWAKLENAGQLSMQVKNDFVKFKDAIDKDPDKFTDESIGDGYNHFSATLKDHRESPKLPPRLVSKTAPYEYTKNLQAQAKEFVATNKDWQNNPDQVKQNIQIAFADKSRNPGIMDALKPRIDALTPQEKTDLTQLAGANGFSSPEEYLFYKDFESQLGEKEIPFDFEKFVKDTMPGMDMIDVTKEVGEVTKRTMVKELRPERAEERAKTAIKSDPSLLQKLIKQGRATDEATAIEALKLAYLNAADREVVKSTTLDEEGYAGTGFGREEAEQDWDIYDKAIRGEINTWNGKELTPHQKRVIRRITGSYVDGVEFDGGTIVASEEGKSVISGGKGRQIPYATGQNVEDISKAREFGKSAFGEEDYGTVPILIKKKTGSKSVSKNKGTETVTETEPTFNTEERHYGIYDNNQKSHLQPGVTKEWYYGGLRKRKELFKESITRALEEDARLQKIGTSNVNEKIREQQKKSGGGTPSASTPNKLGEFNLDNPNE